MLGTKDVGKRAALRRTPGHLLRAKGTVTPRLTGPMTRDELKTSLV